MGVVAVIGRAPLGALEGARRMPAREPLVSVVVPTLNEAQNLPAVLARVPADVHELILVDGGSTDDTVATATQLWPDARVIRQQGTGKGDALSIGFSAATGDIVVTIDGDGSTDPAEIPRFVAALESGADLAKGSRFLDGGGSDDLTPMRRVGARALTAIVNRLFGTDYTDLCYGYTAFWRRHLDRITIAPGFEVETSMTISAAHAGLAVMEVASFERQRAHGASNLRVFRDGVRILRTIVRAKAQRRRHPKPPSHTSSDEVRRARARAATRPRLPRGLMGPAAVLAAGGLVSLAPALGTAPQRQTAARQPAPVAARPAGTARPARTQRAPAHAVAVGAYIPGATRHPKRIAAYTRMTGRRPAIIEYFRRWAPGTFDELTLRRITRTGAVPLVTWEPWRRPLRDIAAGRYDRYIRSAAAQAARFRRPILVRFAHEMNGDWYPWASSADPRTYIRAWRHVVRVFRGRGARNVGWVWAPNVEYRGLAPIRRLYPGDKWVDWAALSGFSWGGPWAWQSVTELFGRSYGAITRVSTKPVMIAETAAGEIGGNKARWIKKTFARGWRRMPRIRAVVWFNGHAQWARWDVDSTHAALRAFRGAVAARRYSGTAEQVTRLTHPDRVGARRSNGTR